MFGSPFPILSVCWDTVCHLVTPPFPPPLPLSLQVVTQAQYQAHLESLGILIKAKNFLVFQVEFIIVYAMSTHMHTERRLQIHI